MKQTPAQRAERAREALSIYLEPAPIREVAQRLDISYGTAYALIKSAGGPEVFRARGTRVVSMNHDENPEVRE